MTRVDSHLHVWQAAEGATPGVQTIVSPQTDVPIENAWQTLREHHIDRAVLVQPVFRGEDNSYVATCARAEPDRFAAVCVVDPRVPGAEDRLQHWAAEGCRGVRLRPRLADEEAIFGAPSTYPLWQAAERLGLVVSLLSGPAHVDAIADLAERFPKVAIVIDHLNHPTVEMPPGRFERFLELARYPRVFVKTSGFHHFSRQPFPFGDCWDWIRAAYDTFGPRRLLWGSDFPHVVAAVGYENSTLLPQQALPGWNAADEERIMGRNALELYWPEALEIRN